MKRLTVSGGPCQDLSRPKKYQTLAGQILASAGFELYDQYVTQLLRYSQYEVCAYYALGLGLRREIAQSLGV